MILKIAYKSFKAQFKDYFLYFTTLWISILAIYTFLAFSRMIDPTYESFPRIYAISKVPISYVVITMTIPLALVLSYLINYGNNYFLTIKSKEVALYKILGVTNKKIGLIIILENFFMLCAALIGAIIIGHPLAYIMAKSLQLKTKEINIIINGHIDINVVLIVILMFVLIYTFVFLKFILKLKRYEIINFLNEMHRIDDPVITNIKVIFFNLLLFFLLLGASYYIVIKQVDRVSGYEYLIVGISIVCSIKLFFNILAAGFFNLVPKRLKYNHEYLFTFSHMSANIQKSIKLIFMCTFLLSIITLVIYNASVNALASDLNVRDESAMLLKSINSIQFEYEGDLKSIEFSSKYTFKSNLDYNFLVISEDSLNEISDDYVNIDSKQVVQVQHDCNIGENRIGEMVELQNSNNPNLKFKGKVTDIVTTKYSYVKTLDYDFSEWEIFALDNSIFEKVSEIHYIDNYVNELKNSYANEISVTPVTQYTNVIWEVSNPMISFMSDEDISALFDERGNEDINFSIIDHQPVLTLNNLDANDVIVTNKKTGKTISFDDYTPNTSIDNGDTIVVDNRDISIENGFIPISVMYLINYNENPEIDSMVLQFDDAANRSVSTKLYSAQMSFISDTISQVFTMYMGIIMLVVIFSLLGIYSVIDARTNKARFIALRKIGYCDKEIKRSINCIVGSYFIIPLVTTCVFAVVNVLVYNQIVTFELDIFIKSYQLINMVKVYIGILIIYCVYFTLVVSTYKRIILKDYDNK